MPVPPGNIATSVAPPTCPAGENTFCVFLNTYSAVAAGSDVHVTLIAAQFAASPPFVAATSTIGTGTSVPPDTNGAGGPARNAFIATIFEVANRESILVAIVAPPGNMQLLIIVPTPALPVSHESKARPAATPGRGAPASAL